MTLLPSCAILLVDDSEDDAELVRRALTRGGVACSITRVDDEVAFRASLQRGHWDLVITDYSQPSFGAMVVLDVLRRLDPEMPCVVISGVAGEDRAVETMRAGARDFVSKDRLQRLAPAVQREVAEGAQRRERAALRAAEGARERRMREASASLFELLSGGDFATGNAPAVYRTLTELVSRTLEVDRVSVWMFEAGRTVFRCAECFDRRDGTHATGTSYEIAEHPEYFRALESSRFVEAHQSSLDARGPHEGPHAAGVSSQLDAAIRFRGEMVGALCLDHVGMPRRWRTDEQVFVGSIADLLSLAIEGTERRRAELALRESEVRYRELWEHALDGMFTLDPQGRVTSANEAGCRLTGRTRLEMVGHHFTAYVAPRDVTGALDLFMRLVHASAPMDNEPFSFSIARPDGSRLQVETTAQRIERGGTLVEVLAIVRDVSQRRQLEAQLQQSQKMEAIGRLAGGVAHDFNNLLTAIIGYSQIATIRPDMPAAAVIDLKEITSAAHRAAALTRQLLAFSRRQVMEPRVLNVNAVVSGIEVLLRRLIGEDIVLATDLDATIPSVLADPSQLEQVILNLAVNARDAMPNGGRIALRTRTVAEMDRAAFASGDRGPGPWIVLEVADTGVGMDEETRSHIFEPFYTTKALGTGLGLSTVYGIVQQTGGGIAVTSEVGAGSTFTVFLPVVVGNSDEVTLPSAEMGPGGSETVLVVEDDDRVRSLASRVLRLSGYTVLEASEPQQAIAEVERARSVDLVLTDLVLPLMRGRELVQHLRAMRPRLKALYMSGYRQEAEAQEVGEAFLSKPFTPEGLTTAVRAVLDGEASTAPAPGAGN